MLVQMLNALLPDSKRRPKHTVIGSSVLSIKQWASIFESEIPEIKALLEMLDKRLRRGGSHGGSHVSKNPKRGGCSLSKSERRVLERKKCHARNKIVEKNPAVEISFEEIFLLVETSSALKVM